MTTEKRLIDPNALVAIFEEIANEDESEYFHLDEITQEIFDASTVDAVEVVHGRWGDNPGVFGYICNQCNKVMVPDYFDGCMNYCPNCGTKMDGDNK